MLNQINVSSFCGKDITIAIPTFNREGKVVGLLSRLKQEKNNQEFNILVGDNSSNDCESIQHAAKRAGAGLIRRSVNIGPGANILRLFEETTTEWLIILGDDDTVESNFLTEILEELNLAINSDVVAIKFKTLINPGQTIQVISDISAFSAYCTQPKQFSSTLLISSWIYRRKSVLPYLRYAYLYNGVQSPHLVLILYVLSNKVGKIRYCERSPIKYNLPEKCEGWNVGLTYSLMLSNLPTVDVLSREQVRQITSGIVGVSVKQICGTVYRLKMYRGGIVFRSISKTILDVSLKHRFVVTVASFVTDMLSWLNVGVGIDLKSENLNSERM